MGISAGGVATGAGSTARVDASVDIDRSQSLSAPPSSVLFSTPDLLQESFSLQSRAIADVGMVAQSPFRYGLLERNLPIDLLEAILPRQFVGMRGEFFRELSTDTSLKGAAAIISSMDWFSRRYLENVFTRDAWNELGPELGVRVLSLANDLLGTTEMRRLSGVKQMHAAYTSFFRESLDHTRLEHSLEVGVNAARMAKRIGLPASVAVSMAAAGFTHDVGHPPFSHTGEKIISDIVTDPRMLAKLGCRGSFDHENYGWSLIKGSNISQVLKHHGSDAAEVVAILDHKHPFHPVIDWEDRLSYLARDLFGATTSYFQDPREVLGKRCRVLGAIDQFRQGARQFGGQFVFSGDPKVPEKLLNLRLELLNEVSLTPDVLLVNAVLKKEIDNLLKNKVFTVEEFLGQSDLGVIERMPPRIRDMLKNGVDRSFEAVNIFYSYELSKRGSEAVYNPQFPEKLAHDIAAKFPELSPRDVLVAVCSEPDKHASLKYLRGDGRGASEVVQETYERKVFPWCQSVSVFISRGIEELKVADISGAIQKHFENGGLISTEAERAHMYRRPRYQRSAAHTHVSREALRA